MARFFVGEVPNTEERVQLKLEDYSEGIRVVMLDDEGDDTIDCNHICTFVTHQGKLVIELAQGVNEDYVVVDSNEYIEVHQD